MPLKQLFEIHSKLSGDLSFMLVASRNYKKKKRKRNKKKEKQKTTHIEGWYLSSANEYFVQTDQADII